MKYTKVIGLLGGSFNPPHAGHVHLSLAAIKSLRLDEVWWLVSPQNPLKEKSDTAPYATRLQLAHKIAAPHKRIHICDFEQQHQLFYSVETIQALQREHPHTQFIWLMGADNLVNFHRWRAWEKIFHLLPIAVFDRAPFSHKAPRSKAAMRFASALIHPRQSFDLGQFAPPRWVFVHMQQHPASSTDLRKKLGKGAFLGHNENVGTS